MNDKDHQMENEIRPWEGGELGEAVRSLGDDLSRSSQHEEWAWTRLQARMREEETSSPLSLFWKVGAFGSVALLAVVTFWPASSPVAPNLASIDTTLTPGNEIAATGAIPTSAAASMEVAGMTAPVAAPVSMPASNAVSPTVTVEQHVPNVWVSTFHANEPHAEVIWAEGYDYVPASYALR